MSTDRPEAGRRAGPDGEPLPHQAPEQRPVAALAGPRLTLMGKHEDQLDHGPLGKCVSALASSMSTPGGGSAVQSTIREARLKPDYASLYPGVEPGIWLPADGHRPAAPAVAPDRAGHAPGRAAHVGGAFRVSRWPEASRLLDQHADPAGRRVKQPAVARRATRLRRAEPGVRTALQSPAFLSGAG